MDVATYIEQNGKTFFTWGLVRYECLAGEGVPEKGALDIKVPYETWYAKEQKTIERIELKKILKKDQGTNHKRSE